MPVEVRDAAAAVAYYLVPARPSQALIAPSGLRVAEILPRRALCTIGTMDYRDNDLGQYHELAITFFVHAPGARSWPAVGAAAAMLRGGLPVYIHQLPVDAEFSCEAGRGIWGFPKFMSSIDISRDHGLETSTLLVEGRHVLTQRARLGGGRVFGERPQASFALRDGMLYRTPSTMSGERVGFRLGGARIELGDHPIAHELRSLGLPKKPLFSTTIGRMRGRFTAPDLPCAAAQRIAREHRRGLWARMWCRLWSIGYHPTLTPPSEAPPPLRRERRQEPAV